MNKERERQKPWRMIGAIVEACSIEEVLQQVLAAGVLGQVEISAGVGPTVLIVVVNDHGGADQASQQVREG